jgi:lipopolysaccharide transport system permease protein
MAPQGEALPEVVYSGEAQFRRPGKVVRQMAADFTASVEQARWLFVADLRAQHRRSALGYLWVVLPPLATMLTWVFLSDVGIITVRSTQTPYPVYVLTGTMLWQLFIDTLNCPLNQAEKFKHLLTRVRLPSESLLLGGLASVFFDFLVRMLLVFLALLMFRQPVTAMMLLTPVGVLALVLLGLAIGTLLTPIGLLYRDVQRTMGILTGLWFFVTPVVYPMPSEGRAAWLMGLNPVTPLLIATREMMTTGHISQPGGFLLVTGASAFMLVVASVLYRVSLPHLVSRIPSR